MFLKNNKGFSMLEILVSVGIVSLLIGVAAPAYNQYKKGSTKTAMQSELSNLVKAYNAKNAVEASYCHTLKNVGFTADGGTPLYAKQAYMGFGAKAASCGTALDEDSLFIKTNNDALGSCSVGTFTTQATCVSPATWTADPDRAYTTDPNDCQLGEGGFYAGAVTGVSALNIFFTTNQDGVITQQGGGTADDPNSFDCADDAAGKYADLGDDLPGSVQ